jgi:hypothetical protein
MRLPERESLAFFRSLRDLQADRYHPFVAFTWDDLGSLAEQNGLDYFSLLGHSIDSHHARALPLGCWPPTVGTIHMRYLGGAKAGSCSLYLWGDEEESEFMNATQIRRVLGLRRVYADCTIGGKARHVQLGKVLRGRIRKSRVTGEARYYWEWVSGNGDEEEVDDSLVMWIGDRFYIYNYPRDLVIDLGSNFRPRRYRLENKLTIGGKPVKGRYEVANLAVCSDGQYLYAGLRSADLLDRALYVVGAAPTTAKGSWPTTLLRRIDGYYANPQYISTLWHDCIAVDDTMVLVVGEKLYWWEKDKR